MAKLFFLLSYVLLKLKEELIFAWQDGAEFDS